jgi:hypothetical protein
VEGLLSRVGDGNKIRIWSDKWVPTITEGFLQSPIRILDRNATVSKLLDWDTN